MAKTKNTLASYTQRLFQVRNIQPEDSSLLLSPSIINQFLYAPEKIPSKKLSTIFRKLKLTPEEYVELLKILDLEYGSSIDL